MNAARSWRMVILLLVGGFFLMGACNATYEDAGIAEQDGQLMVGAVGDSVVVDRGVRLEGRTLVFEGFHGAIRLEGTDDESASLSFVKRARGENEDEASRRLQNVQVDEEGDDQTFQYTLRADEPELSSIDVEGTVPRTASIQINLESGPVELSGVRGPVEVRLQNGDVRIGGVSMPVSVETSNGSIAIGMRGDLAEDGEVRAQTQNGNITLILPQRNTGEISAETTAGNIVVRNLEFADRSLTPEGAGALFSGMLNEGEVRYTLQTENGTITLREGSVEDLPEEEQGPAVIDDRRFPDELRPRDPAPADTNDVPPDTNNVRPDTSSIQ